MSVPAGFKATEVGVIPEDWEVCALGDIVEFLDSKRRPVKSGDRANMRGIYPYYGASGIVDYVSGYLFDEELILLGEDGENILSRNLPLAFRVSGKIWVNNHAHVMRPSSRTNIGYLTEYLESVDYSDFNSGTAQPKLNKQACIGLRVALPPIAEQAAIADALSDVDEAIACQEAVIAKKRALKTATMQALLSGTRRLPGFSGEWEVKTLDKICPMQRGFDLPTSQIRAGNVPVVYSNGVSAFHDKAMVKAPGIVTGRSGTIGNVHFVERDYWPHNTSLWVTAFCGNDPKFLLHFLRKLDLSQFASGSGVPTLNRNDFHSFKVKIPKPKEQAAIAAILSDIDLDLASFQSKLAKLRHLKTGMMQQLLTGKIRLV